jgi:hypothetical protein
MKESMNERCERVRGEKEGSKQRNSRRWGKKRKINDGRKVIEEDTSAMEKEKM